MSEKVLSVVIPCYNEENNIEEIVKRVLASPIKNKEIIVVDDCYKKHIDFSDEEFKSLPTQVGVRVGKSITTNGKTGFLLYGPYIPVQKRVI